MRKNVEFGPRLLRQWIDSAANCTPDKSYIISTDDRRTLSYGQLSVLTQKIASFLADSDIRTNDRIALLAENSIEHLICYLGVMAYGATVCTIHVEMNRRHLARILPKLNPRLTIFDASLQLDDVLSDRSEQCRSMGRFDETFSDFFGTISNCVPTKRDLLTTQQQDDACILFTSGTSAKPKGVVLTFRELLANVEPTAEGFGLTANDRIYDFRSFNWCSAQVLSALAPLSQGATLILGRKFTRSRFFQNIAEHDVTIAAGNPTTINMLLNGDDKPSPKALASLRFVISSSAPLLDEDCRRFEQRFGIAVAQGYGCSEIGWIAMNPGINRHVGTVGKPAPYHKLAIVNDHGEPLPAEDVGHIEVGGVPDNEFRYIEDDGFIKVHSRGRLQTGDIGFLDSDGYLHITGREKDLIIRGGVNISPLEIDSLLLQRPEIVEVATVGVPDQTYGEEVVSFVVARPGANIDVDDLLRYCGAALSMSKAPKQIILSHHLPKTARGKLDRRALADQWTLATTKLVVDDRAH
ncbi:MAG: class I adenylate-forming enzyme family protein [Pseudorhodoplanes sp.]|jgi:acyl-coenzyme A synthetase/AMP-(fatty) acid ligase|nr:class I adenylate-forming enzyme family protein [Pseudorhodoplanes sp.]